MRFVHGYELSLGFPCGSLVKNPPTNAGDVHLIRDPVEKEITTYSSILAWEIPWTEEPGRLQSMWSQSQTQLNMHACKHTLYNTASVLCSIFPMLLKTSVQFSHSVVSDSLWPHGLQNVRLSCPSPSPRACSSSCPLSQWCHPTISSPVISFSSCVHSFTASGSFPMSQFFTSSAQSTGISALASVLPMNT